MPDPVANHLLKRGAVGIAARLGPVPLNKIVMRHRGQQTIFATISAVLFAISPIIYAGKVAQEKDKTPIYEWTEGDAWKELEAISQSPECSIEKSIPCRKLMLHHFCKYRGASFYLYACSAERQLSAELPLNEWTEWDAIMTFPSCVEENSKSCIELKFHYSCKYSSSNSRNAIVCAGGKQEEADNKLLGYYKLLFNAFRKLASLEPQLNELPTLLASSQEAWSVYREKECNFVEQYFKGGTLQPALWSDCMREESIRRLQKLEKHAEEYAAMLKSHGIKLQINTLARSD